MMQRQKPPHLDRLSYSSFPSSASLCSFLQSFLAIFTIVSSFMMVYCCGRI